MSGWKSAQGKMVMSTSTATGVWWYTLLANFLVHYKSFLLYMYVWIIMLLNPALNNNNFFYYIHFEINCDPHNYFHTIFCPKSHQLWIASFNGSKSHHFCFKSHHFLFYIISFLSCKSLFASIFQQIGYLINELVLTEFCDFKLAIIKC